MKKIAKLLRTLRRKDRERLLQIIERLANNDLRGLNLQKITGTDFYRIRSGRYRLIFHREPETRDIVVDSIRLRREDM